VSTKKDTTAAYFSFFDKLNADIAARKSEEPEEDPKPHVPFNEDAQRIERDAERRERLGQLRARPHSGKRPNGMVHKYYK
jgi:hypothetical protein